MDRARRAVFLDRDGVLNFDDGYTHRVEDLRLLPGVASTCRALRAAGFLLVVITNQAGIARGLYGEAEFHAFMNAMRHELEQAGTQLDGVFFCPHHPEGTLAHLAVPCRCRKPEPGMILEALHALDIDPTASWLVGDKESDRQAGIRAGIPAQQCIVLPSNTGLAGIADRIVA